MANINHALKMLLVFLAAMVIASCGGGGGSSDSGGVDDTTPPTVAGTSPDDVATNVGRSTIVVAVFSENLDAATVNSASFTLTLTGGGAVTGTVSFDASTLSARFVPDTTLDPLTNYTASLAGTITDVAGNALAPVSWTFTTDSKGWASAARIDDAVAVDSVTPRMAMDVSGNAMVVWEQDGYIWSNRYTAGSGWGGPVEVYNNSAVYAWKPEVAVDPDGNAIAVWQQGEPNNDPIPKNHYHVLASYYTAATTSWSAPQYLGDTPVADAVEDAYEPHVAMDSAGNALVVWTQTDNTHGDLDVWANRYLAVGGWQGAGLVDGDTATVGDTRVAFDAGGNALVVWSDSTFPTTPWSAVWAKRHEPAGTGWQATVSLGSSTDEVLSAPQLAFDAGGNAIVVWQQFNSTPWLFSVWANRYQAGGGWSGAQLLEHDDVGDHSDPAIAMDPAGNAMAVWAYNDGHIVGIQASRYVQGTNTWTAPEDINARVGNAMVPSVAMDSTGNAIAVWVEGDGGPYFSLWTNRYIAGSGWGTIELVEYNDGDVGGTGMWPQIAIDNTDGSAIAVWAQDNTTGPLSEIWANRFE